MNFQNGLEELPDYVYNYLLFILFYFSLYPYNLL